MKTPPKDRGPLGISLWLDFDCSIVMEVPALVSVHSQR